MEEGFFVAETVAEFEVIVDAEVVLIFAEEEVFWKVLQSALEILYLMGGYSIG